MLTYIIYGLLGSTLFTLLLVFISTYYYAHTYGDAGEVFARKNADALTAIGRLFFNFACYLALIKVLFVGGP